MEITTTGSHEAQDELGDLLVPVSSSFTQTDINKFPNKKQAQGRKERVPFYQNKKVLLQKRLVLAERSRRQTKLCQSFQSLMCRHPLHLQLNTKQTR